MRAIRSLQSHCNAKKSEVKEDTGNLIGIPDIIWEMCQVQWGRMWRKSNLEAKNPSAAFVVQQFSSYEYFLTTTTFLRQLFFA